MKVPPSLVMMQRPIGRMLFCSGLPLLVCVVPAKADYQSTVLSRSPVGYWRLNDVVGAPGNTLATNIGTLGAAGNGTYEYDILAGVAGALPAQVSSNTAVRSES